MLDIIIFVAVLFIFIFTVFLVNMMVDMKNELGQMKELLDGVAKDIDLIEMRSIDRSYRWKYEKVREKEEDVDPMGYTE